MGQKELALKLAWRMYGVPYIWGGDDPIRGLDCSGMQVEILKSVGILPVHGDWTAHSLWLFLKGREIRNPIAGALAFWGDPQMKTHVEMCLDDRFSIGASSGGSGTTTVDAAIRSNAFVKVRPIYNRGDRRPVSFADPFPKT